MKRDTPLTTIILLAGFLAGCGDFLERTSDDLMIPRSAKEYKELLQGEAYFKTLFEKSVFAIYMTDDVEYRDDGEHALLSGNHPYLVVYQSAYGWAPEAENDLLTDGCFLYLYTQILAANTCLTALDEMEGTPREIKALEGQARFTRAFAYFLLANFYACPYNEAGADDPCVPLVLEPYPTTDKPNPATIETIWNLIDMDIAQALACLKDEPTPGIYEIGYNACLALATRIALFKEDYQAVISYGEVLLGSNNRLYDITTLVLSGKREISFMSPTDNPEIIWMFDNGKNSSCHMQLQNRGYREYYAVSAQHEEALISLFDYDRASGEGDRRLPFWFNAPSGYFLSWEPAKYDEYAVDYTNQNAFRTAEVYLSLAEAYARKENPDSDKALYYLNALRSHRITPYTALTGGDFGNPEALMAFIWEERRRELCLEEHHRWWDLRRQGQPALTHAWKNGAAFTLEKGGSGYVLAYPRYEREYNQ